MNRIRSLLSKTLMVALTVSTLPGFVGTTTAQNRDPLQMHHHIDMPAGMIGREQAASKPQLRNHFQSVDLIAPEGANISIVKNGRFQTNGKPVTTVGMKIGELYRVKITNIPDRRGFELYPSIEVINRLYTPRDLDTKFAIPLHFTIEDLHLALDGGYVTRVVYLENPREALPVRLPTKIPQVYDVSGTQDPLHVADRLGRPMAILRIGSRVPDLVLTAGEQGYANGSPPLMFYEHQPAEVEGKQEKAPTEPATAPNALPALIPGSTEITPQK